MQPRLIHFISGLGIDERAFSKLVLPDGYEMRNVRWIDPEKGEAFPSYCRRLLAQIDTSQPLILAGLSLGGMVSAELNKIVPVEKTILISSIPSRDEMPKWYRLLIVLGIHRLIPATLLKRTNPLTYWVFGIKTKEERRLLKAIMADMSSKFLVWALKAAAFWENETVPKNMVRIHGTKDRVLYFPKKRKVDFPVKGAGHFMVFTHPDEVNAALRAILQKEI